MAADTLDDLFRDAVRAIDAGDLPALEALLANHPRLACERLEASGGWLRDKVGKALDDFFARPYVLWFVAEDPVRNGKLPPNTALCLERWADADRLLPAAPGERHFALTLAALKGKTEEVRRRLAAGGVDVNAVTRRHTPRSRLTYARAAPAEQTPSIRRES